MMIRRSQFCHFQLINVRAIGYKVILIPGVRTVSLSRLQSLFAAHQGTAASHIVPSVVTSTKHAPLTCTGNTEDLIPLTGSPVELEKPVSIPAPFPSVCQCLQAIAGSPQQFALTAY